MTYRDISVQDIWRWIIRGRKSPLQQMELRLVFASLVSVPFLYIHELVPKEKEFFLFQSGYYLDLRIFVDHFFFWIALAVLSSWFFFLCKRRWSLCVGALALNYWWCALCSLAWGVGILQGQGGEQIYMLPLALVGFYFLWRRRSRWHQLAYKEDEAEKGPWRRKDYWIGGALLFCVALTHITLFPQTPDFYFIHIEYFKNVHASVFFFGIHSGAVLWMSVWFFECRRWYRIYLTWPLLMFAFVFINCIVAGFQVEQYGIYYAMVAAPLLTSIMWRARAQLYADLYHKELIRLRRNNFTLWRDWFIMGLAGLIWLKLKPILPRIIYIQLLRSGWMSEISYSALRLADMLSGLLLMAFFLLWLIYCKWWWQPYILLPLLAVCFATFEHLGAKPYEDSNYWLLAISLVSAYQMWRMRAYLFWDMVCCDDAQAWESLKLSKTKDPLKTFLL